MLMYYPWCILFISVPVLHERYINMEKIYTGGGTVYYPTLPLFVHPSLYSFIF
jgi:hypothetical protein